MKTYKPAPNEVVVTILGGVAEIYHQPKDVRVTIVDYDNGVSPEEDDRVEMFNGSLALIAKHDPQVPKSVHKGLKQAKKRQFAKKPPKIR